MSRKAGLPPVWRPDARLLILGSLPGEMSLAASRYYGNPRNAFWRLLESVGCKDLQSFAYEDRLEALKTAGIALWDVIAEAERPGSLDGAIRDESPNDLAGLIARLPALRAVAFNGGKAATLGRKVLAGVAPDVARITLPSSSPAYTLAFERKAAAWAELRRPLGLVVDRP
ncbi:MAG: DNA-deoxyinosine glycosylase [Caulobacter sp.]|nr:DNA-deoxyinosine glycosylase [Caulobacter sp.]